MWPRNRQDDGSLGLTVPEQGKKKRNSYGLLKQRERVAGKDLVFDYNSVCSPIFKQMDSRMAETPCCSLPLPAHEAAVRRDNNLLTVWEIRWIANSRENKTDGGLYHFHNIPSGYNQCHNCYSQLLHPRLPQCWYLLLPMRSHLEPT